MIKKLMKKFLLPFIDKSFSFSPKKTLSDSMRAARLAPLADLLKFAFSQLSVREGFDFLMENPGE